MFIYNRLIKLILQLIIINITFNKTIFGVLLFFITTFFEFFYYFVFIINKEININYYL